jgi:hypothetical protein
LSKRDHVLAFAAVGEVRIATPSGSGLALRGNWTSAALWLLRTIA